MSCYTSLGFNYELIYDLPRESNAEAWKGREKGTRYVNYEPTLGDPLLVRLISGKPTLASAICCPVVVFLVQFIKV